MKWVAMGFFRTQAWEFELYKHLGVPAFKRFMLRCAGERTAAWMNWRPIGDPSSRRTGGLRPALESFRSQTRRNEIAHWLVLIVLAVAGIRLALDGRGAEALVVLLMNIPVNVYPVMLQRHSRYRIDRVLARSKRSDRRGTVVQPQDEGP